MTRILSDDELKIFHRDGYIMVKNFFSKQEIDKLYNIAIEDKVVKNNAVNVTDKKAKIRSLLYGLRQAMIFTVACAQ